MITEEITEDQIRKMIELCLDNPDYVFSRSYSGRGMFGRECISISTKTHYDDYELSGELYQIGVPRGNRDNMGLGTVFYWPGTTCPNHIYAEYESQMYPSYECYESEWEMSE